MSEELFKQMAQSILDGDEEISANLAKQALEAGIDPLEAITSGYMPGVNEVGDSFACGQAFLPELVMAGEAMKAAIAVLEPAMKAAGTQRQILGKVVLATVEGDIHEIGKSLVGTMLTSSGFEVYDLGVDVSTADILAKATEVEADIVGLSALLTTTMNNMQSTVQALQSAGLRDQVKVVIGGAPVTDEFARKIGADAYAPDASNAVRTVRQLIG